jgi:hypothetical protein
MAYTRIVVHSPLKRAKHTVNHEAGAEDERAQLAAARAWPGSTQA